VKEETMNKNSYLIKLSLCKNIPSLGEVDVILGTPNHFNFF